MQENSVSITEDDEILGYIQQTYTKELAVDLTNAVALMYDLEVPGFKEGLIDLLYQPEMEEPDLLQAAFADYIQDSLITLLSAHDIIVNEEATTSDMVAMLSAFNVLQNIEDPVPYLRLIETDLDNEEKLSKLVSYFSLLDEATLMTKLTYVDDGFFNRLTKVLEAIEQKELSSVQVSTKVAMIENFKLFIEYAGQENIAYEMLQHQFPIGLNASIYYSYVSDHLDLGDPRLTAVNLLAFFYMANDTWEKPIEVYRQLSDRIIHNPAHFRLIETEMSRRLEEFDQFRKAKQHATL